MQRACAPNSWNTIRRMGRVIPLSSICLKEVISRFFAKPPIPLSTGTGRAESRFAEPSIVVLPFSNLSPDPEAYFSDGLSEEIIHALSSIRGIRVVARTSAFALKYRNADVLEIGRLLNVDFVLDGSVRKSGEDLRVTVQLARPLTGISCGRGVMSGRSETICGTGRNCLRDH